MKIEGRDGLDVFGAITALVCVGVRVVAAGVVDGVVNSGVDGDDAG